MTILNRLRQAIRILMGKSVAVSCAHLSPKIVDMASELLLIRAEVEADRFGEKVRLTFSRGRR